MSDASKAVHAFFQPRKPQTTIKYSSTSTTVSEVPNTESRSSTSSSSSTKERKLKKQDSTNHSILSLLKPSTPTLQDAKTVDSNADAPSRGKRRRAVATGNDKQATETKQKAIAKEQKDHDKENEEAKDRPKKRTKRATENIGVAVEGNAPTTSATKADGETATVDDNKPERAEDAHSERMHKDKAMTMTNSSSKKKPESLPSIQGARKSARLAAKQLTTASVRKEQQQKAESSTSFYGRRKPSPPALEYCTESFAKLMEGPQFYHDPEEVYCEFEKEIWHNVYGIDKRKKTATNHKNKKNHDHEFSRLDPDIFGTGHITASANDMNTSHQIISNITTSSKTKSSLKKENSTNIRDLLKTQQTSFFQSQKAARERRKASQCNHNSYPSTNMLNLKSKLTNRAEVERFLSVYFPQWQTYSSCVLLFQSIFQTKNKPRNDYFIRENMKKQWTDKYRPKTADGLLGGRHNFIYLKDWLQQMKIEPISASAKANGQKKRKSKSKKKKKLIMMQDDFIVDDDDFDLSSNAFQQAVNNCDNDEDDDDFAPKRASSAGRKKLQLQKDAMKSNIILLVGDHGVGKTAAVYTIADQLDYEVFEINSGSKRSGKDIVSMVGDMTRNHLVAFSNAPPSSAASLFLDKPSLTSSSSVINDSDGSKCKRRKILNPLFKPSSSVEESVKVKTVSISKSPHKKIKVMQKEEEINDTQPTSTEKSGLLKHFIRKKDPAKEGKLPASTLAAAAATTKQSLILLEEVDILFEEDKGFWNSVVELSQSSKRPIVMTCNDPDQIPFESLCLQIVLDLKPPHDSELLPYLWLLCYGEGHVVDPKDLLCFMTLFGQDIRKLIQTLDVDLSSKEQRPMYLDHLGINVPEISEEEDSIETLIDTKKRCIPSKLAVDTFRLATAYKALLEENRIKGRVIQHHGGENGIEQRDTKELEILVQAFENNAFVDSWSTWKQKGAQIQKYDADPINGYTILSIGDEDIDNTSSCIIEDMQSRISIFNSDMYKKSGSSSTEWSKLVVEEGSHWDELCDARVIVQEGYQDAVEKLLPLPYIYQPDDDMLMMEYIPYIRSMVTAEDGVLKKANRSRPTRSKRKRRYLPLNDECVKTLVSKKVIIDETEYVTKKLESFNNTDLSSAGDSIQ